MLPTFRSREAFVPFSTAFSVSLTALSHPVSSPAGNHILFPERRSHSLLSPHMGCTGSVTDPSCCHRCFCVFFYFQKVTSSYHLIDRSNTQFCHIFAQFLCDKAHEVFYIFRFSFETFSQFRVLVATPTGQVSKLQTLIITHPIVTSGAVAKPNSSAPSNAAMATSRPLISLPSVSIRTRLRSPFCNRSDGSLQVPFPWKSGVVDRTLRSGSGTSVVTGDQDNLCTGFCNTCCYRSDTCFGNQFYRDPAYLFAFFRS